MNTKNIPKLTLFLNGLSERYKENSQFFVGCEILFKSGLKSFLGKLYTNENNLELTFLGNKEIVSFEYFCTIIVKEAVKYDSLVLTYNERGSVFVITADEKGVATKQGESKSENISINPLISDREYFLKVGKADNLLKAIGIMTNEGKIKNDMIRKYNQTDRFIELTADYFNTFSDKPFTVVDCACGKSYLSFALNYYLCDVLKKKCKFIGIDISDNVISESKRIAKELKFYNMEFIKEDLMAYEPSYKIDAVISLHACDTATDMAIGLGIRQNSKVILCVPCCHKELLDKFRFDGLEPIMKTGVLKTRLNDILTDGLRILKLEACGYEVSAIEYISPLDTPKNLLIRALKVKEENSDANEEYKRLCKIMGVMPAIEGYSHK